MSELDFNNLDEKELLILLNAEEIVENHNILDKTLDNLNDPLNLCNNPQIELTYCRTDIWFIEPIELQNTEDPTLITVKKDIHNYIEGYINAAKEVNSTVDITNKAMKELYEPSKTVQKNVNNLMDEFEKTTENLCVPLKNKIVGFDTIDTSNFSDKDKENFEKDKKKFQTQIDNFIEEAKNLNKIYKGIYTRILEIVEHFCDAICALPESVKKLRDEIELAFINFEDTVEDLGDLSDLQALHLTLLKLKKPLEDIINKVSEGKKCLDETMGILYKEDAKRNDAIESHKKESQEKVDSLKIKSDDIIKNIVKIREKYRQHSVKLKEIKLKVMEEQKLKEQIFLASQEAKKQKEKIEKKFKKIQENAEKDINLTKLDMLIILDITGSMDDYLNEVQNELILMIDGVHALSPASEVNVGFIGYRDILDPERGYEYVNLPFSKDIE